VSGKNLRAAPYDWRFGPQTFAKVDWPCLRALIEDTYSTNNNSKGTASFSHTPPPFLAHQPTTWWSRAAVLAVSLSMGGPYFLGFLNQQTQAWKDKYLHSYVSLDGAFGGSPSATAALISLSSTRAPQFKDLIARNSMFCA
jgi:lysophospholipase-3